MWWWNYLVEPGADCWVVCFWSIYLFIILGCFLLYSFDVIACKSDRGWILFGGVTQTAQMELARKDKQMKELRDE
jgi:hypothetical protein